MFNSALIYELAVLKLYAEPILFGIEKDCEEYVEAKRLLKFLDYFIGVGSENIPANSLLREFVGGGCFKYKNIRNIVGRQSIDCLLICIIEKKIAISSGRGEENVSGSW